MARETVYPKFLGSFNRSIFSTTLIFDAYRQVWKGGVLAYDFNAQINNSFTPWPLREELGSGSGRMRGYYSGRYIDCSQMVTQLELRQHIHRRIGCVAWVGTGTVLSKFKELKFNRLLPNYGLGLRIEAKHNLNMRIDYGFGKDAAGFVFQLAEAF